MDRHKLGQCFGLEATTTTFGRHPKSGCKVARYRDARLRSRDTVHHVNEAEIKFSLCFDVEFLERREIGFVCPLFRHRKVQPVQRAREFT